LCYAEEYLSFFDFYEEIYPIIYLGKSENLKKRPEIADVLNVLKEIYNKV